MIKNINNTVLWTYVIEGLNDEEIVRTFHKKKLLKTNQTEFRVEQVIKKGNKLYVTWKGYDNLFNIWINIKDIV